MVKVRGYMVYIIEGRESRLVLIGVRGEDVVDIFVQ